MDKENKPQSNLTSKDLQKIPRTKKAAQKLFTSFTNQESLNLNQSSSTSHQIQEPAAPSRNHQAASPQGRGLNQFSVEQSTSLPRENSRSQKHQFKSSVCNIFVKRGILKRKINLKRPRTRTETARAQTLNKRRKLIRSNFRGNDDNDLNNCEEGSEHQWKSISDEEQMVNNPAPHQIMSSTCEEALKRRQRILSNLDSIRRKTENLKDMSNISEIAEKCLKEKPEQERNKEQEEQIQQEENETDDQQNFYKNFENLGTGSFGKVIRQLHIPTRKFYAFKELKVENDEKRERIAKQEFKLLKAIREANIPILLQIKDLKCSPNFFARMEYGYGTLSNFLHFCKRKRIMKKWTDNDILTLYFQLWSQLQALKELKIFHSDIKPTNIIISPEGFFVISDFGVSILLKKLGRQEMSIQGTYNYYMDEIKKVRDEEKWSCEYDPMDQDQFACTKIIRDIIFRRDPSDSLEKLFERANIKSEKDYQLFATRSSLPIYNKKKEAYHIYLLDQYYKGYSWDEKQEIIYNLIEYCHFDQINKWLKKKLEEEKYANPQEYVYLCFLKARALAVERKYQKALKYYKACEDTLSSFKYKVDSKYISRLYSEFGEAAVYNYDFALARKYIEKSREIKMKNGSQTIELAQDYWNLAFIEYDEGNRENAVENCEKGLKLFEQKNINVHFLELTNLLASSLEALGRYDQAEEIFQDLKKRLCQIYGEKHLIVERVLSNIAMIFDNTDRPKDALSYNRQSLKINEELFLKGNQGFAYTLINMTVCYAYLGELEEALQCACESVQVIKDSQNNDPYVFVWMITMAEICVALKQYQNAKDYLQQYLDSYEEMSTFKDKLFLQKCFVNWDFYVYKRKDLELALKKYNKRWSYLAQQPETHLVEAFIHQRLALIEILNEKYQDALHHLRKAHKIIEKNHPFFSQSEIDLDRFFESNNSLTEKSSKNLKSFCEEYYQKYTLSLMVAPKLFV